MREDLKQIQITQKQEQENVRGDLKQIQRDVVRMSDLQSEQLSLQKNSQRSSQIDDERDVRDE